MKIVLSNSATATHAEFVESVCKRVVVSSSLSLVAMNYQKSLLTKEWLQRLHIRFLMYLYLLLFHLALGFNKLNYFVGVRVFW